MAGPGSGHLTSGLLAIGKRPITGSSACSGPLSKRQPEQIPFILLAFTFTYLTSCPPIKEDISYYIALGRNKHKIIGKGLTGHYNLTSSWGGEYLNLYMLDPIIIFKHETVITITRVSNVLDS